MLIRCLDFFNKLRHNETILKSGGSSMATEKKPRMLRLPEELYEKVRYLAYIEHRSVNMQIEHALTLYIADYEKQHGPIVLPEAPGGE